MCILTMQYFFFLSFFFFRFSYVNIICLLKNRHGQIGSLPVGVMLFSVSYFLCVYVIVLQKGYVMFRVC